MPRFEYAGQDQQRQPVTGTIEAPDRVTAFRELHRQGIVVHSLQDARRAREEQRRQEADRNTPLPAE